MASLEPRLLELGRSCEEQQKALSWAALAPKAMKLLVKLRAMQALEILWLEPAQSQSSSFEELIELLWVALLHATNDGVLK